MDTKMKRVADGLAKAIQAEVDGYHFYMMSARSTSDPKGRETFEMLAQEEMDHQHFLKKQYKAITETGKLDSSARLGQRADLSGMSPIFSDQIKARARDAHYEMSALSIGIQLELSAVNFYKTEAEAAPNEEIRAFYLELADWETGHYRALLNQQESLKEDYWSDSGFSPF